MAGRNIRRGVQGRHPGWHVDAVKKGIYKIHSFLLNGVEDASLLHEYTSADIKENGWTYITAAMGTLMTRGGGRIEVRDPDGLVKVCIAVDMGRGSGTREVKEESDHWVLFDVFGDVAATIPKGTTPQRQHRQAAQLFLFQAAFDLLMAVENTITCFTKDNPWRTPIMGQNMDDLKKAWKKASKALWLSMRKALPLNRERARFNRRRGLRWSNEAIERGNYERIRIERHVPVPCKQTVVPFTPDVVYDADDAAPLQPLIWDGGSVDLYSSEPGGNPESPDRRGMDEAGRDPGEAVVPRDDTEGDPDDPEDV